MGTFFNCSFFIFFLLEGWEKGAGNIKCVIKFSFQGGR